jgi:hypothetical protein
MAEQAKPALTRAHRVFAVFLALMTLTTISLLLLAFYRPEPVTITTMRPTQTARVETRVVAVMVTPTYTPIPEWKLTAMLNRRVPGRRW